VAYSIQVDLLERRVATAQIVAGQAAAAGAENVTWPDPHEERAKFDASLLDDGSGADREATELRRSLGVA
jgi:hypothetical protein